jgi:uncharacterized protein (DUF1810 family)
MKTPIYPKWEDLINETYMSRNHGIQHEITRSNLVDILEMAQEIGIDEAIQDFIEANYEPIDWETDIDYYYDQMRDEKLMESVA